MMSINAVKGVEIGDGMSAALSRAKRTPTRCEASKGGSGPTFLSNHAGGILGGISTGQPIVARFAVEADARRSSRRVARSIDYGAEVDVRTKGRHDPCVGIRAVPVGEAMMAIVLADAFLRHRGQVGEGSGRWPFTRPKTP